MSEYQYYEFQTVDRLLTTKEQAELKRLSSRAQVNASQAVFVYHYGDFRGDPESILTQYFDAMFYVANWGTWQLIFRFPRTAVDSQWFEPYEIPDFITVSTSAKSLILNINIHQEEYGGWAEGEGWLSRLISLREELMTGDRRLLYLAWLRIAPTLTDHIEEDLIEPPVPPNLGQLSPALKAFIEWVELDPDWVDAAAQISEQQKVKAKPNLDRYLTQLSNAEKDQFLLKLLHREPHVDLELLSRLQELAGKPVSNLEGKPGLRGFSEIEAIAQQLKTQRQQKQATIAKRKRTQYLKALVSKEEDLWRQISALIELKQARPYDEATILLKDLKDLAESQNSLPKFNKRFEALKATYGNRPALMKRFKTL
ncbi:hypothetical protein [Lyngbya confervoides]|uniref:DNA polymerase III subunit delta n=1 Tax=Lyngbya confervoides BDU141951 TaxID=1574623 RepID=A0ABD4T1M2_9CYAN|nr:hypothetical protein [Lyngbya confervoides]MCM1982548.1 hypothetical protein [Lyngbya confervoides BDU141951]